RNRRSHDALKPIQFTVDPVSGLARLTHRVAKSSGYVRPGLTIRVPKLGIGGE
ncbi:MAG: 50S ribosomal protein L32, partial [Planctomycetota bacterium]